MRVANWQEALAAVFSDANSRRFRWGRHDCCQFADRCVTAITGQSRRVHFPRYRSRTEAEEILAGLGGMRGLITRALGEPVHPSRASLGDIVLVDMGMGLQPAVCMGVNCFAPGMRNLQHRKTIQDATDAWLI